MKAKILVTGGTGFIGSHTTVELIKQGYEPIIVDNLSNSSRSVTDGIKRITGVKPALHVFDLCDRDILDSFFASNPGIVAIIHFAASKAVGESVEKPLHYYRNNLLSLINLLDLAPKYNIPHFVFSSSCTVYGEPDELPVSEKSSVKAAESPYGNTKQIGEEIIRDSVNTGTGVNAISLRYFNPVGAHLSGEIGEEPRGVPENLVPYITQTAAGIRDSLKVFGNDYNTPDGSCIRDYLHVTDLSRAHVIAIERLLTGANEAPYEVFNLGMGKGVSVLEVITAFERSTGLKVNYKIASRRPGDIEKIWADSSLANEKLGWKTEISIDEAMLSAWRWEKKLRKL